MTDNTPSPANLEDLSLKSFLERSTPDTFKPVSDSINKNLDNSNIDLESLGLASFLNRSDNTTFAPMPNATEMPARRTWGEVMEGMRDFAARHPEAFPPLEVVEMKLDPVNFEDISGLPQPDSATVASTLNDKIGKLRQENNAPEVKGPKPV